MQAQGLKYAEPQPGVKFRVIGAGLPRSGTNSFCAAIAHLLHGPGYQAAIQCALSPTARHVKALIRILRLRAAPDRPAPRTAELLAALGAEMSGFVAAADAPLCCLVPELLALHPDALVVCTVRDRAAWAESMWKAARLGNPRVLSWLWFWVPVLRWSPTMWAAQTAVWRELYGVHAESREACEAVWERHHEWLRRVVPKEKLFFVDVKDGWGPICRALGVDVPEGVEFPRLNDATALEKTMKDFAVQGIMRWMAFVGVVLLGVGVWWSVL